MAKVGPFEKWADCVAYLNLWTDRTRGRKKRLERGIELWREMSERFGLTLWTQTRERDDILESIRSEPQVNVKSVAIVTRKRKIETKVNLNDMDCAFRHNDRITIDIIKRMQIKKKSKT